MILPSDARAAKNLQTLIYVLFHVPLTALLTFPITSYEGFYREHQYGLSNLSFMDWLRETGIGLGVNIVLTGIAITGLYAILRRVPQPWWAWGTIAGAGFMMLVFMIAPAFIAPLFNTYQPVPDCPIRDDILSLARANGIPAEDVYYFDASKQTKRVSANVSGYNRLLAAMRWKAENVKWPPKVQLRRSLASQAFGSTR